MGGCAPGFDMTCYQQPLFGHARHATGAILQDHAFAEQPLADAGLGKLDALRFGNRFIVLDVANIVEEFRIG